MTYFLRFTDEATWTESATAAGFYSEPDEDGKIFTRSPIPEFTAKKITH